MVMSTAATLRYALKKRYQTQNTDSIKNTKIPTLVRIREEIHVADFKTAGAAGVVRVAIAAQLVALEVV